MSRELGVYLFLNKNMNKLNEEYLERVSSEYYDLSITDYDTFDTIIFRNE